MELTDMIGQIVSGGLLIFVSIAGWSLKRGIFERLDAFGLRLDELKKQIEDVEKKMLTEYATTVALEKAERDNHTSHKDFWDEIRKLRDDLTAVKTRQQTCKYCSGEKG